MQVSFKMLSIGTVLLFGVSVAAAGAPTATIDTGPIVGTTTSFPSSSTTVNKFLGVPFGTVPKRFMPAEIPEPWTELRNTTSASAACIQQFRYPEDYRNLFLNLLNTPAPEESEDCLNLNVYAPATRAPDNGRAVMFWIFGGGLFSGHGSYPVYDGSHLASYEDVIVVTPNYRTNIFGFPNAPSQKRNLGFMDQRLALDWVQRNIASFGGDPKKVTIFGESAGSLSVDALITGYPGNSTPPFRAAIMQSGQLSYHSTSNPGPPGLPYPDKPAWDGIIRGLNCTNNTIEESFECVQNAPASLIKDISEKQELLFMPVADNDTFVSDLTPRRRAKNIARVPLLIGTNQDEGSLVGGLFYTNLTTYLNTTFGSQLTPKLLADIDRVYPMGSAQFPTVREVISAIEGDTSMLCGTALVAQDTATSGLLTWRYLYNATFPSTFFLPNIGVYHTSEISMVFSTYPIPAQYGTVNATATPQQFVLSNLMRAAWARFAKDPTAGPGWTAVGSGKDYLDSEPDRDVAVLSKEGISVKRQKDVDERCAVWKDVLKG
ncbi:unnamed protein product [Periconia digitata]|uniref:Carboxylic ester hydrolase n=1 Tax=Periconia digitata TaxID=1303443 RepID=A0A9W4U7A7_9PLEO|nr:unnamed protein product [Periconia digitata]